MRYSVQNIDIECQYLRLATLRYKPFQYNTKSRYGAGIYKRTKDVTAHNNRSGKIIDIDNTRMLYYDNIGRSEWRPQQQKNYGNF